VLEAIMAVAILSIALLPLMNLQSQFVKTVESYERVQERVAIEKQILERFEAINIGITPEGNEMFGNYTLVWSTSDVLLQDEQMIPPYNSQFNFQTREKSRERHMYSLRPVRVRLTDQKGRTQYEMQLYNMGWAAQFGYLEGLF